MRNFILSGLLILALACESRKDPVQQATERPNIVLIMGDDIGFSDIGCYGSEIKTPNLDNLAGQGMRFTHFYNMSKCETTRSVLLHGQYRGNTSSVALGELFRQNGYATAQFGKEHFQKWVPETSYAKNSFDNSLVYWAINNFFIPPDGKWSHPFELNGKKIEVSDMVVNQQPFFKTDVLTDYAIGFIDSATQKQQPFLLYLPYHIAHYPLQARPEDIEKYRGKYMEGWDVLREKRLARMKEMGIVSAGTKLSPPEGNINKYRGHPKGDEEIRNRIPEYFPWGSLSDSAKQEYDLEMAVFAAMIDRMDQNIGRILQKLEERGIRDNTLILYLSDNGSCPYDSNQDFKTPPGPADSYRTLDPKWANLGNTPFRYFKQYGHEGGPRTQLIVNWPARIEPGVITGETGHVVDLLPTLIEAAGITYPENYRGEPTLGPDGRSLLPVFEGGKVAPPEFLISGFSERFRMFRQGDYKIVKVNDGDWELYNLADDPTELNNLASSQKDRLQAMAASYLQKKNELDSRNSDN